MEINATLYGQMITFAILVWFTMKYVWPPITQAMQDREKKIAAGLDAAERSNRELEQAEHKALNILKEAKQEASQIVDVAQKRSITIVEDAKETARAESNRIISHAQDEINREVSQVKEALRMQLAGLAIAGAEKIIQRQLDASTQHALLDDFIAKI